MAKYGDLINMSCETPEDGHKLWVNFQRVLSHPYSMRQHAEDFVSAAFDTREGAGDGSRWWYVNTLALSWSRERGEK